MCFKLLTLIKMYTETYDVRFKNPGTILVSGNTGSGKSTLVFEILKHPNYFFQDPRCMRNVILYYKEYQPIYEENKNLISEFINQVPTYNLVKERVEFYKNIGGSVILIDDFANELHESIRSLFGVGAHHWNTHIFLLTQYLFPNKPSWFREITSNCMYLIYFKNPMNSRQIRNVIYKCFAKNPKWAIESVENALQKPHSYILFDFHQNTPDLIRLRTNILPKESPMITYTVSK